MKNRVLILALLLDLLLGDPPNRWHPVAWMGRGIGWARDRRSDARRGQDLLRGAVIALGGMGVSAWVGYLLERRLSFLPRPLRLVIQAWALKSTFSLRGLLRAVYDVRDALDRGDLEEARHWLGWHLVSRDTRDLSQAEVVAATVESLAENMSDGVVAPLFYYMIGGLPAALAYRFANTADAMLGYRDAHHEWLGKVPARVDDVLNLIPARLSALALILAGWLKGAEGRRAWRVWRRDAGRTASPNAGHPMAAMAGLLGVRLEKRGHYRLAGEFPPPRVEHIDRAVKYVKIALALLGSRLASGVIRQALRGNRRGRMGVGGKFVIRDA